MRLCGWGAGLADVGEDLIDDGRIGDVCYDPQCAATQRADGDIELESPFESLRPGQSDWLTRLLPTVTDRLI